MPHHNPHALSLLGNHHHHQQTSRESLAVIDHRWGVDWSPPAPTTAWKNFSFWFSHGCFVCKKNRLQITMWESELSFNYVQEGSSFVCTSSYIVSSRFIVLVMVVVVSMLVQFVSLGFFIASLLVLVLFSIFLPHSLAGSLFSFSSWSVNDSFRQAKRM